MARNVMMTLIIIIELLETDSHVQLSSDFMQNNDLLVCETKIHLRDDHSNPGLPQKNSGIIASSL